MKSVEAAAQHSTPQSLAKTRKPNQLSFAKKSIKRHWQLYLVILPIIVYFIVFKYIPMVNSVIAFKDYSVVKGIWGSPWAGFKHFELFFKNPIFWDLIGNTLLLSIYQLAAGFPIPILLALALNEVRNGLFKRTVQMVTYAPHFISTVVMVSMIMLVLSPKLGIVNTALMSLGIEEIDFLSNPDMFRSVYVWSDIWQGRRIFRDHLPGCACGSRSVAV